MLFNVLSEKGILKSLKNVCELGSQETKPTELKSLFASIRRKSPSKSYSAKQFYASLGINRYCSIDLNGHAHKFDLNLSLRKHYKFSKTFDLVTNFGTSEHCFDQSVVFRNIHNLCANGGYMLHTLPSQGWIGHCFFRYDENFFKDVAAANSYELVHLAPYALFRPRQLNMTIVCILRKKNDGCFVTPIQGVYQDSCK